MTRIILPLVVAALGGLLLGCPPPKQEFAPFQPPEAKDYGRPLPPGALALRKIPPEQYPDFGAGFSRRAGLEEAIRHSLAYLGKPSSQKYFPYGDVSHARAVRSLERFLEILNTASSPEALNEAIRAEFDVYQSVGYNDRGVVYFTGYYTPIFDGSSERTGAYRYPLYRQPEDLVKDEEGRTLGRRRDDGAIEPRYPTRREIEENRLLDGYEIAYLKTPFEAYVVTVQGSAKLRQPDGTLLELGYAANNGHDYTPIANAMIQDGIIRREELSLQRLLQYFREHPERSYHYCWKNDRYVFFQRASGGPYGCLNVPVTPFRSLATDKEVFPRACLAFFNTNLPVVSETGVTQQPYASFALDQDAGGAIRAAGRADVYMGVGPAAEAVAGRTGSEGALYYIFVKER